MLNYKFVFISVLMLLITLFSASAITFNNQTQWQYGNSSFKVTYTLAKDITLDNLTIYDTGIIINNTDNISFVPTSGNLNITLYNWTHTENDFSLFGQNQSVAVDIKISGSSSVKFLLNDLQNRTSFNATDSSVYWNYVYDVSAPVLNWTINYNYVLATLDFTTNEISNITLTLSEQSNTLNGFTNYSTSYKLNHQLIVDQLDSSTKYYYKIVTTDMLGNTYTSDIKNFTTDTVEGTLGGGGTSGETEMTFFSPQSSLTCVNNKNDIDNLKLDYESLVNLKDKRDISFKISTTDIKGITTSFNSSKIWIYHNKKLLTFGTTTDLNGNDITILYDLDKAECGVGTFSLPVEAEGTYEFKVEITGKEKVKYIEFDVSVVDKESDAFDIKSYIDSKVYTPILVVGGIIGTLALIGTIWTIIPKK